MSAPEERLAFSLGGRKEVTGAARGVEPVLPSAPREDDEHQGRAHQGVTAEPRDWAFTWTLVFTAILFFRPQDLLPPLEALHLAELSAIAGLVSLIVGRLARRQPLTRMTPEF